MSTELFSPLHIKSIILKNRVVISPMCQYSSEDGFTTNWHLVHLGSRAIGGAGLIIQEATAVSIEGRISPDDAGIWKDEHIENLSKITLFILEQGAIPGIQLAHAGRKASVSAPWKGNKKLANFAGGWETFAPSAIGFHHEEMTTALSQSGIDTVISDFKKAATRALSAGYKFLEIHAAHGYLLHQFLSPLSNERQDKYGGSFENRIRFTLEILEAVQTEWPDNLPISVRISATDWADGGWNIEESVKLAKILKGKGVDIIDVSSGGLVSHQKISTEPNYQVPFAEKIKIETGVLTGAVGLITEAKQAQSILNKEQADLIFFGRESLRDPNLALHFAHELNAEIQWPKQYERAKPR